MASRPHNSMAAVALLLLGLTYAAARPINDADGVQWLDTTYNVLVRTGANIPTPDGMGSFNFGDIFDKFNRPVLGTGSTPLKAKNPDFMSYLKKGSDLYAVVQFESAPATYFVLGLDQDKNGHLGVKHVQHVSLAEWEGAIRPCAGSISPWNTHLSAEESEPDVSALEAALYPMTGTSSSSGDMRMLMSYYGIYETGRVNATLAGQYASVGVEVLNRTHFAERAKTMIKPYMIGHIIDIDVVNGKPSVMKMMAVGRSNWEVSYVMPDRKTMYLNDDATRSGGFVKFVSLKAGDMSQGALYAAKFTQTNAPGSDAADASIAWIKMADVDAAVVLEFANKTISESRFSDIFFAEPYNKSFANGCKSAGFRAVLTDRKTECLKLNMATPNVEMLAAALETRRYLSYVGASSQLSKLEGITYDEKRNQLFFAISFQRNAMEDNHLTFDMGGDNAIAVAVNLCGCVYAVDLDKEYSATRMHKQLCGREAWFDSDDLFGPEMARNTSANQTRRCGRESIANPDNLSYMEGLDWLIICEDSSARNQNLLWAHNVVTGVNRVIGAAEEGAEVAAGYWYDKLSGYAYITANFQETKHADAPIGYLGPWKIQGHKVDFLEAPQQGSAEAVARLRYADAPYSATMR